MEKYIFMAKDHYYDDYTIYKIGTNLKDVFKSSYENKCDFTVYIDGDSDSIVDIGVNANYENSIKRFVNESKRGHLEMYSQLITLLEEKKKLYEDEEARRIKEKEDKQKAKDLKEYERLKAKFSKQ